MELPPQPPQVMEATVLAPPEPTPPPEDIPLPEPPPPPEIQARVCRRKNTATEDNRRRQKFTPIKAPKLGLRDRCRCRERKPWLSYAPRPQYPYEARSRHVTGSGVIVCTVDSGQAAA